MRAGTFDAYDAAYALVEEVVQPYLDDIRRRAEVDLMEAASEISIGLLEGLAGFRNPDDGSVLGYAGPETAEQLAADVAEVMHKAGIRLPLDWFDDHGSICCQSRNGSNVFVSFCSTGRR